MMAVRVAMATAAFATAAMKAIMLARITVLGNQVAVMMAAIMVDTTMMIMLIVRLVHMKMLTTIDEMPVDNNTWYALADTTSAIAQSGQR